MSPKITAEGEKLKKWLSHNGTLKIISVLLAFILWLAVVNYIDPEVTAQVNAVIEVKNADEMEKAEKLYTIDKRSVNISYTIRSKSRNSISSSDFHAYIDLSDYSITGAVPVYVDLSEQAQKVVKDFSYDPIVVHVSTEDVIRRRIEVNGIILGKTADGHVIGGLEYNPQYVYVKGPASEVGKISELFFEVDAEGAVTDISGREQLRFRGLQGKEISSNVELNTGEFVQYTLKVYGTKSVTVKAAVSGRPAPGYSFDAIETEPTFISVSGPESALEGLTSIVIPRSEIDISGAEENKTFNFDINQYLPQDVQLNQGSSQLVVLVKIRSVKDIVALETATGQTAVSNGPPSSPEPAASQSGGEAELKKEEPQNSEEPESFEEESNEETEEEPDEEPEEETEEEFEEDELPEEEFEPESEEYNE